MNKEILMVVDAVSNEKGVEKEVIFQAMEAALASATRKRHGEDIEVRVSINRETGEYETFRRWMVFADDSTELEEPARELRLEDALDLDPSRVVECAMGSGRGVGEPDCTAGRDGTTVAQANCTVMADGEPLQWDYGHLTKAGAVFVASRVGPQLFSEKP